MILATLYFNKPEPICVDNKLLPKQAENSSAIYSENRTVNLKKQAEKSYLVFNTEGDSMYPTIRSDSTCLCFKKNSYKEGDIVVYFKSLGESLQAVGHRVIYTDNENFITKGDNNALADTPIKKEDILCQIPTLSKSKMSLLSSKN